MSDISRFEAGQETPPAPPTPATQAEDVQPANGETSAVSEEPKSEIAELNAKIESLQSQIAMLVRSGAQVMQTSRPVEKPQAYSPDALFSQPENPHANVKTWEELDFSM